jgi:hypothetical protein
MRCERIFTCHIVVLGVGVRRRALYFDTGGEARHTDNAHTLWYVFSLTLSVSVLFFYIYENSRAIQSTPLGGMTGTIAVTFMKASMDVREGIYILLTAGALLILPQILSYLISGIFGCGFAIEAKALILEESAEEITSTNDPDSEKAAYARVFQA